MIRKGATLAKPYHKYVFDTKRRKFIGDFEEMYKNEIIEGYDSWQEDDLTNIAKQIPLIILTKYNFKNILDIGCGKGTFTSMLKKNNNSVTGIDISQTAISRAKAKYPDIKFQVMKAIDLEKLKGDKFDLVVAMEVLSYLKEWINLIKIISVMADYFLITLYLPPNPIGFVKS